MNARASKRRGLLWRERLGNGLRPVTLRRRLENSASSSSSVASSSMVWTGGERRLFCSRGGHDERNRRAQECQVCADEDEEEEEGRERHQGIVIVIAFVCVVRSSYQCGTHRRASGRKAGIQRHEAGAVGDRAQDGTGA